mmetsp:Transcript_27923/g.59126  ORF Transcript_27923/g.59126 Transcript_27923/m.59126 type:complete len:263 (+) Transcript_27923:62-850(+)
MAEVELLATSAETRDAEAPDEVAIDVHISNLLTGAPIATFKVKASETGGDLKVKLAEYTGKQASKLRLVFDGDAIGDAWRPAAVCGPVALGMCVVQRTDPEHIEPLPLLQTNYWSTAATPFDDGEFLRGLLQEDPTAELASVKLIQSEGCVKGICCKYRTQTGIVDAPAHDEQGYGFYSDRWPESAAAVLEMEPGEHIVRVLAKTGEILDRLELHTDLGKSVIAGGDGGGAAKVDIEQGSHIFGFSGHRAGGVMVRVGFHIM